MLLVECEPPLDLSTFQRLLDSAAVSLSSITVLSMPLLSTAVSPPDLLTVDFSAAINLETLTLWLDRRPLGQADMWLAHAPPSKLREVKIIYFRDKAEDELIDMLSDDDHTVACAQVDQLLSSRLQYKVLNKVSFELVIGLNAGHIEKIPSEHIWREFFSSRLLKIRERGILQTPVIIGSAIHMLFPDLTTMVHDDDSS
ncbi:uncharacterized protein FIBRA_08331 [Fibroporia radiculosa]|uniref:Uncharacterized protein n=1 Tax=Fibroporia radiculosa TaxID=599839 RepID=J4H542_9APHY|nr:uncharacterized protein FIBRA_08331 [Fibroporia radiculosa]CCM06084.1 predicted protein [Fibroporia radiculosa]